MSAAFEDRLDHPERGRSPQIGWRLVVKRAIDLLGAAVLLIIAVPALAIAALFIVLESGRPVFYRSVRVGRNHRRFRVWKLRSMKVDADDSAHREFVVRAMTQPVDPDRAAPEDCKMRNDPRVTRVGAFLRRASIDELPQLFNVLAGEMSLVGPRPEVEYTLEHYQPRFHRRFDVLPGITGLWQVSGRSELTVLQMLELDVTYVDTWSIGRDLGILVRTVPSMLTSKGAGA